MKRSLYILLLWIGLIFLMACRWSAAERDARSAFKGTVAPEVSQQVLEKEVHRFLDWYSGAVDSLVSIQLVDNSGVEDTGYYRVNADSAEAYLAIIEASGIFTSEYIADKRAYFRLCDEEMKKDSLRQGGLYELDADLILLNQEYEEDSFNFDTVSFSNYVDTENGASIDVTLLYTLRMDFVIKGDKLLIDRIDVVDTENGQAGDE
ncbi:hypothetical protein [Chitinophaga tropicalis]|uniref:DUF3828 domain-containing protein n=1 Tax=Chitinophaga tropicalis TaxID=2683588 RepID=A0A7K1UC27_9BACT|nr:hypothetical protein [Chitinophaga tropicalis]MVT11942.1 hypothetical protein [Chitinophaga tropicalis]